MFLLHLYMALIGAKVLSEAGFYSDADLTQLFIAVASEFNKHTGDDLWINITAFHDKIQHICYWDDCDRLNFNYGMLTVSTKTNMIDVSDRSVFLLYKSK